MPDTPHLGLPLIEAGQAQKHVTHNEALVLLDTLVQLAVTSRSLSAPPASPAEGDRYIVKATGTGAFAGKDNQLAHYSGGGWLFYPPKVGWLAFIDDEGTLVAWDGAAWVAAVSSSGDISELQNLLLLGVGTEADAANPFSAKLNNALWTAKTTGEGGDGTLRYKLSKEDASKTLSFLFQDNFSGRAEVGLCGDDDFHFKVSPDGSSWTDALILDKATGAAKLNAGLYLTGDISPAQLTADQNDYNPSGLSTASVLRLSSDASRNITGLAGGGDGRIVAIVNVGTNAIVLKDAGASSAAANRFAFGADVTLSAKQSAVLWYDATDQRWKLLAAPQTGGGGGGETPDDLEIVVGELALGLADALNAAQYFGAAGNRFADSFDALTYVDTAGATNLDTATAGLLKPTTAGASDVLTGGTASASSTSSGAASNLVDNNTGTYWQASGDGSSTAWWQYDLGAGVTKQIAKWRQYWDGASSGIETATIKASNSGAFGGEEVTVASVDFNLAGGAGWFETSFAAPSTAYRYWRIYSNSTVNTFNANRPLVFEFEAMETAAANNVTVASQALTAASAPGSMRLVARAKFIDTVTLGTDFKLSISRDGGTTWTYATLHDRFTTNSIHVIESDAVDVSSQPSGTSVKWRWETANNKSAELHDIYLSWS